MREKEEWRKELDQEYSIYAIPSWLPGVWPLLPDNFFTAFRFYVAVILLFSTILILSSELIRSCGDARQITDQLVFCAVTLNSTTKTILLRIFRKKVSNNYKEAEHDWSTTEDKDLLEIMESHRKLSRKVYFFEAAVHYILLAMYMIAPKLSEQEYILPLQTACLSSNISEIGYQSVYFLQCLQSLYVFNGNVGTDFFFFAIVMHICGQVEILRIRFSKITKEDFNYDMEHDEVLGESIKILRQRNVDEMECFNRMNSLIERHVKLINLANDVQNTLSITLLVQLSTSIIIMCILGIQTLLFLQVGDTISAGRTSSGFLIVALGLFLYCYMGDCLQFQFEKVSEAVYFCNWYNLSSRINRNVVQIQMRASHLINFSAGKMCDMNLEMFKTALKTAMSFFPVMRIVFENEGKISTVLIIGTEVYFSIIYHCGELKQTADHFLFWIVTVIATIKTILLRFHRDKLLNNCNSARTDWLKEDDPESLKVMAHHAKVSRNVFIFQAVFSYFTLVMYVIAPMASKTEDEQALPLQTVCVFKNMSAVEYQVVYLLQAIQQLYIVNGNIGTDYFFFAMIMHVCGQMKILSLKFHQFGSRGAKYNECDVTLDEKHDWESFRKIRILINRHCELIGLADDLKQSLTYILLVQFTMDIIMMCLTGLLTLIYLQQGDTVTAGRTICGFSIVVMSLFIYCYIGDYLQSRFKKTAEAIYSCFWYNCSPKVSRNIIHIQTRGLRLMNLTVGTFCNINLEMFKTAMKTAMSFFSVMRILLNKNGDLELELNY